MKEVTTRDKDAGVFEIPGMAMSTI